MNAQSYVEGLKDWRTGVFSADAWRSFAFIVAAAALLWLFGKGKVKKVVVLGGLGVLLLLDQWTVDRRYINSDTKKPNGQVRWEDAADNAMPYTASAPIRNLNALGAAWFVEQVKWVKNSDEEIQAIKGFAPDSVVVVDERYRAELPQPATSDPTATVELKQYATDRMEYTCRSANGGVVVFSEIWYGPDWVASIDGQPAPYARANYILRAMNVPAGEHTIVFHVKSRTYGTGGMASMIGSALVLLLVLGAGYMEWKRGRADAANA